MTKTKRIVCPHCRTAHKPGEGYTFNEDLSVLCGKCNKVIFPTTTQAEVGLPKAADRRYSGNRGGHQYGQWDHETDIAYA